MSFCFYQDAKLNSYWENLILLTNNWQFVLCSKIKVSRNTNLYANYLFFIVELKEKKASTTVEGWVFISILHNTRIFDMNLPDFIVYQRDITALI